MARPIASHLSVGLKRFGIAHTSDSAAEDDSLGQAAASLTACFVADLRRDTAVRVTESALRSSILRQHLRVTQRRSRGPMARVTVLSKVDKSDRDLRAEMHLLRPQLLEIRRAEDHAKGQRRSNDL